MVPFSGSRVPAGTSLAPVATLRDRPGVRLSLPSKGSRGKTQGGAAQLSGQGMDSTSGRCVPVLGRGWRVGKHSRCRAGHQASIETPAPDLQTMTQCGEGHGSVGLTLGFPLFPGGSPLLHFTDRATEAQGCRGTCPRRRGDLSETRAACSPGTTWLFTRPAL